VPGEEPAHRHTRLRLGELLEQHRSSAGAPSSRLRFEDSGTRSLAETAFPIRRQVPLAQFIPVTSDKYLPALMTVGAPPWQVRDVASIGIADAVLYRDIAGHGQGGSRRVWDLPHLPI